VLAEALHRGRLPLASCVLDCDQQAARLKTGALPSSFPPERERTPMLFSVRSGFPPLETGR
jgi:hypothetical protein